MVVDRFSLWSGHVLVFKTATTIEDVEAAANRFHLAVKRFIDVDPSTFQMFDFLEKGCRSVELPNG